MKTASTFINSLRGTLRISESFPISQRADGFRLSSDDTAEKSTTVKEESWLADSRKLIPGEALAGYLALQPISKIAKNPANISIVLAIVFLLVTLFLRWVGTQDPGAPNPANSSQRGAVAISALSFVSLVYATGGQVFWHRPLTDQQLYGQIAAAALGIVGPVLYRRLLTKKK